MDAVLASKAETAAETEAPALSADAALVRGLCLDALADFLEDGVLAVATAKLGHLVSNAKALNRGEATPHFRSVQETAARATHAADGVVHAVQTLEKKHDEAILLAITRAGQDKEAQMTAELIQEYERGFAEGERNRFALLYQD